MFLRLRGPRVNSRRIGGGLFLAALLGLGPVGGEPGLHPLRVLGQSEFHHAGSPSEIVVLGDGERVLSTARDGTARLWNRKTGRELRRFMRTENTQDLWGIALLAGEAQFLTAGRGGVISRWELATGRLLMTYQQAKGASDTVFRVAVRPGEKEFVGTDSRYNVVLWNIETGKKIRTFKGHTQSVYTAMFLPGGDRMLTGDSAGKMKLWDVTTGTCEKTFEEEFGEVFTLGLSPDGARFAMCAGDGHLRVFDSGTFELVWKVDFGDDVMVPSWSRDGARVATSCEDRHLYVLDAADGKELRKIRVPHSYHTPVAFTPDGREIMSGGDSRLYRHDADSGELITSEAGAPLLRNGVELVVLSRLGERVYASGSGSAVQVWGTEDGAAVQRIELDDEVESMTLSPRDDLLALGGGDGSVRIRSAVTGARVRAMKGGGSIQSLAFAKDGAWLVGGGSDDKAYLWETRTGKTIRTFEGHGNDISSLSVSRDSILLVTASRDKTARLWDLENGRHLRSYDDANDRLYGVVMMGDSRSFLISAQERQLWGWLAPQAVESKGVAPEELEALIARLGAEGFAERDAATKELIARGKELLPLLANLRPDDPEIAFRLNKVRAKIRAAELEGKLETQHEFEDDMVFLAADPGGAHWAAVVGRGCQARIVLGRLQDGQLEVLAEVTDGHAPRTLAFSGDGKILASGNRDGTVSLFRVGPLE